MSFKVKDHYFQKAKQDNYLARSAYKLEEVNKKYKVLTKGMVVLDLGYYPGSWIQYTSRVIGESGKIVGLDIKPVNTKLQNLKNVDIYQKDINDVNELEDIGVSEHFDAVISDMAPNTTGIKSVDQARSLQLVEWVFHLLPKFLNKNGNFVIKVFDSHDAQVFLKSQKNLFKDYYFLKPKSTRSVSKEFFVIGKGYK